MCAEKSLGCGYGVFLDDQSRVLSSMEFSIAEMRVKGKDELLPFQVGILVSIASIRGLFQDIWAEGKQCLLTGRCSYEATKECFSFIRSMGPTYEPDQSECVNRIRLLAMTREWARPEGPVSVQPEISPATVKVEPLSEDAVMISMEDAVAHFADGDAYSDANGDAISDPYVEATNSDAENDADHANVDSDVDNVVVVDTTFKVDADGSVDIGLCSPAFVHDEK